MLQSELLGLLQGGRAFQPGRGEDATLPMVGADFVPPLRYQFGSLWVNYLQTHDPSRNKY